jgi:putative tributyrin esterase
MPDTARCWYTDTAYGANYFSYIAHELPELCRRTFRVLSDRREDNIVAGLSMGGYGALKIALTLPEQFGACISLSGALDITRKGRPGFAAEWRSIFNFDMQSPEELVGSRHDIFSLAKKNKEAALPFPRTYLWCGESDTLMQNSRDFSALLQSLDVPHRYEESEGDHSWRWWDKHIQSGLSYVLKS